MSWHDACALRDLVDGRPLGVDIDGTAVCLVRLAGEVFAVHDECTHAAVPLSEGDVEAGAIECWLHGSRFDLRTGAVLNPPAVKPVAVYGAQVTNGTVQVDVDR